MSISTRIQSIARHLEKDWQSVANIGGDTTVNNNIENISLALEKIYQDMPKVTAEGTELTLNPTKKGRMILNLKSNISQETTTGINQVGIQDLPSTTLGGLTYSISEGVLTINGTNSARIDIQNVLYNLTSQTSKTMKLYLESGTYTSGAIGLGLRDANDSNVSFIQVGYNVAGLITTKTLSFTGVDHIKLYAAANSTFNNARFKIMLCDSTPESYESYSGGEASPSSNFPQEVKIITGENTINITSNNLFDASKIENSSIEVSNNGATITMPLASSGNGLAYTNVQLKTLCPFLKAGDVVYIKATTTSTHNKFMFLRESNYIWNFGTSLTITQDHLNSVVGLYGNRYSDGETNQVVISDLRIIKNTNYNFSPYHGQSFPITLDDLEYGKINDYEDLFFKNIIESTYYDDNLELNKWYLKKTIKTITDTVGSESKTISDMISDATVYSYCGGTVSGTTITYTGALSVANTIYYPTTTPTDILLSSTLQTQLDNIMNYAFSCQGQTNIYQSNVNLPFIINGSALLDASTYINSLENQVEALS